MTRRLLVPVLLLAAVGRLAAQADAPRGPIVTVEAPQLTVAAGVTVEEIAPGDRLSLVFDVTPRRNMHVYAPGKHSYQVIRITVDQRPWLRTHPTVYPPSEIYHFKPLDERVAVYHKPFRLVQDATILATPAARQALAGQTSVTISGRLEYQACDDQLCYRPQTVPVSWRLRVGSEKRR